MKEVKIYWWTDQGDTMPHMFLTKEARDANLLQAIQSECGEDGARQAKSELAIAGPDFTDILHDWYFIEEQVIITEQPVEIEQNIYWWCDENSTPKCYINEKDRDEAVLSDIKDYNSDWYQEALEDIQQDYIFEREDASEKYLCDCWFAGKSRVIA